MAPLRAIRVGRSFGCALWLRHVHDQDAIGVRAIAGRLEQLAATLVQGLDRPRRVDQEMPERPDRHIRLRRGEPSKMLGRRHGLEQAPGDPILLVARLRLIDAAPVVLEQVVLPLTGQIEQPAIDWTAGAVTLILEQQLGATIARLAAALTAVIFSVRDAARLRRQPGTPAMETRSTLYELHSRPLAATIALVPSDCGAHVIDLVTRDSDNGGRVTLRQPQQSAEC